MRRPSSPSPSRLLRTGRGLSPNPKVLTSHRPSVLSNALQRVQGILHRSQPSLPQAEIADVVKNLTFDTVSLESWFDRRSILDWSHLAHHIFLAAPSSARNMTRTEAYIPPKGTSVYRRQISWNTPVGLPVSDGKGGISHYEKSWTLPLEAVSNSHPLEIDLQVEESAKRLKCLIEVVEADANVFAVLERRDREALVSYWRCTSSVPSRLKKSGLVKKTQRLDRKGDQAAKEREKTRRKKLDQAFSELKKSRKESWSSNDTRVEAGKDPREVQCSERQPQEYKTKWWKRHTQDAAAWEKERRQRAMPRADSRSPIPRKAFEYSREFQPFNPFDD